MTLLQALILGIVQGLTEFLPVSSSAHLVLVPHLLGWNLAEEFVFPFDVLVQLGTLVAVIYFFRNDLKEIITAVFRGIRDRKPFEETPARIGWLALLATIPAGIFGLLIKDKVEAAFNNPTATSVFLFVTAGLLLAAEFLGKRTKDLEKLTWLDALWIGAFQALAVFPGISRSGSTIAGGMTRNLERKPAGQFSFILAIPIFLAAGLLGIKDLLAINNLSAYLPSLLIGFFAAGIVGYFAIRWLLGYIANHSLLPFAGYCVMLGAGTLAFTLLNPGVPTAAVQPASQSKNVTMSSDTIYQVALEPDLEWLLPAMANCQKSQKGLKILFSQEAFETGMPSKADIALTYGEIPGLGTEVFQVGSETLIPAVNPGNPLQTLSANLSEGLFTGQIRSWDIAVEACPECFSAAGMTGEVNLYIFTPGSVFYEGSQASFTTGKLLSSTARLTPNSKTVRQALSQDLQALAALPKSWVDTSTKTVAFEFAGSDPSSIPILAYTNSTLNTALKSWLACVQNSLK
ncbi:MAG: undecaprenyl-diphosphatase UppP [Pelolinea sp.]|nr:undecaprenyl-diphosphatase UppP [Pelolinea sp.]